MATKTFTQLTAVTTLAAGDEFVQWNASAGAARKITVANFIANSPNGGLAELGAANTWTAAQTITVNNTNPLVVQRSDGNAMAISLKNSDMGANSVDFGFDSSEVPYIFNSNNTAFQVWTNSILRLQVHTDVTPGIDNTQDSGSASYRWSDVYATNATIQTSDKRDKTDIADIDIGLAFIQALRPVRYRWKDVPATTGKRINRETGKMETYKIPARTYSRPHYGLIAQEVKAAMDDLGIDDFAGYIYDAKSDRYGLRYGEFLGPIIKSIQDGARIIGDLQTRMAALEAALPA